MSDENDVMSEVARVLGEHADAAQGERGDATRFVSRWYCTCGVSIGQDWKPRAELLRAHQAAMLAEAGLLRDQATIDALNERCRILVDEGDRLRAQIATQEPAGATQGGSGDSGASGGLGERLRALGTGQTRTLRKALRAMADEADRLENEAELQRHSARSWRVQAEQAQGELRVIEGMSAR